MNAEHRTSFLGPALLSCLSSTAVAGCIVTAFDIPLQNGMWLAALWCALFASITAFAFHRFRGILPFSLLPAALLLMLMQGTRQPLQMQTILPHISQFYHRAYGWPILFSNPATAEYADLVILRLMLLLCFFLCWALARQKRLVWCMLPLAPVLCCVVVYDTVPAAGWLWLLLFSGILLVLTHLSRREGGRSWHHLALHLTPAVALFLAVLFLLVPQTKGFNPLRQTADKFLPWIQNLLTQNGPGGPGSTVGPSSSTNLDLSAIGPKTLRNATIAYVTSSQGGRIYLRQKVLSQYSGTAWTPLQRGSDYFGDSGGTVTGTITIETRSAQPFRYLPYYPNESLPLTDGILPNDSAALQYTYTLADQFIWNEAVTTYLVLSSQYESWAKILLEDILQGETDIRARTEKIGQYVEQSAAYDLNTPRMPANETDFVRWFLEDSDTGYCVHFASAAVVLLRAAGIPARYIEGLAFSASADQRTAVLDASAHAWVEYYDGTTQTWEILDPTPSGDTPVVPDDPDNPDVPDDPDNPDTPDVPDDPDTPDEPDTPDTPDTPDVPAQPDTPDLPIMTPEDYLNWLQKLPASVKTAFWLGAAAAILVGQALLRRRRNRRRWTQGDTNTQALERFRQCRRLAWACNMQLPEELTDLANKAHYSQHQLSAEELEQFDAFLPRLFFAAQAAPLHRKLLRFFIVAV